MHVRLTRFAALFMGLFLYACAPSQRSRTANDPDLGRLVGYMVGHFTSGAQAAQDTAFYDITLHMRPIWQQAQPGASWLYVEQAMTTAQERPYRQRVYKVEKDGPNAYKSIVYTFADPKPYVGAWKKPDAFSALTPEQLILRDGCTVYLEKKPDGSFEGSTRGNGCESNLRGAKYATSTVRITEKGIESWDQGFDAAGKQVWGAEKGGYKFVKN